MKVVLTQSVIIDDIALRTQYAEYKQAVIEDGCPEDEIITFEEWVEFEYLDAENTDIADFLVGHWKESEYNIEIIR